MNALEQDIVAMYDEQDMSVEDIACELSDEQLSPTAIKYVLSVHSHKFQKETVEEAKKLSNTKSASIDSQKPLNPNLVNQVDKKQIMQTLITLMNQSDNDMVRARAAIYLNEEITGRNEKRVKMNNLPDVQMNIRALNDQINKARELVMIKVGQIGNSPMLVAPKGSLGASTRADNIVEAEVVK